MIDSEHPEVLCSEFAAQAQEHLFATAPRARVWLLLEYGAHWESQAFEDSQLPLPVKNELAAASKSIPRSRVQMIRHHVRPGTDFAFYMAVSQVPAPRLYAIRLKAYADLLRLDLPSMANGDSRYDRYRSSQPLILVCTHATRDQCCAKLGVPVYNALARQSGLDVWQSSHVGGHRFAANIVCLPEGVYYGRITPPDVERLVDNHRNRRITLDKYRGQSSHEAPAQAAEYFVRTEAGLTDMEGLTVSGAEEHGDGQWHATCKASDGAVYTVEFVKDKSAVQTYTNCKDPQPSGQDQFRLVSCARSS